jgi:hypothetical protein
MSCDWNIKCITCDSTLVFNDANHQQNLMVLLVEHRRAIGRLATLLCSPAEGIRLATNYGNVDAAWFAFHAEHDLRPVDEYGRLMGQCNQRVTCPSCTTEHPCVLDYGHAGPHSVKP